MILSSEQVLREIWPKEAWSESFALVTGNWPTEEEEESLFDGMQFVGQI
jgi:hypothetical protein